MARDLPTLLAILMALVAVPAGRADGPRDPFIEVLLRQLGDSSWKVREAATRALEALPIVPRAALIRATKSDDRERAIRAQQVLRATAGRPTGDEARALTSVAVFATIARLRLPGLASSLSKAIPHLELPHVKEIATAALAALRRQAAPARPSLRRDLVAHWSLDRSLDQTRVTHQQYGPARVHRLQVVQLTHRRRLHLQPDLIR